MPADTIFALSSGGLPAGLAVVRISGPAARIALETICGGLPPTRRAAFRRLRDPASGDVIDEGLAIWMPGPGSFTGEDVAELHVHGGRAVVAAVLAALARLPECRMAEPGEFSRRAFANGRIDLTQAEGLADLLAADTEKQRRQAVQQAQGLQRSMAEGWRREIVTARAMVEAELDFADEDDVPGSVSERAWPIADSVAQQIRAVLADSRRGEIVRDGYEIVLVGPPNAGKSSLLNALAARDVAIVAPEPGTTRDLLEVDLDIDGYRVTVVDTAGIRDTQSGVEREGIRRARQRAGEADLAIWLSPPGDDSPPEHGIARDVLRLGSKDDEGRLGERGVSVVRADGLQALLGAISARLRRFETREPAVVTRERHRQAMLDCLRALEAAIGMPEAGVEIRAEHLRAAGDALGRLVGRIDVEDILDLVFSEFCIGK